MKRQGRWLYSILVLISACFGEASALAAQFQFVVIGDTRPKFESENFGPFQHLIPKINDLNPALVINLGDLIYGYGMPRKETQWDNYQKVIRSIKAPYYQVPGNHDTHSRTARRIYGKRFGKFYESFDYEDFHFVLLDTTEDQHWGYIGPAELEWLKKDLKQTKARAVFVFTHFPVWEPERVTPEYYDFWAKTLHPLFRESRVRAVFAGHYHAYGPTREYDGIRYFITGGGGAELRPEYRKSGGEFHFMKVNVQEENFDVRVITERGELTDTEADVMGGLQFAARHVSRIGIRSGSENLRQGVKFDVAVSNPYHEILTGEAGWLFDAATFSVEPSSTVVRIPVGTTRQFSFTVKALQNSINLQSLPRLQFRVGAGGRAHRFHRELRFLQPVTTPYYQKSFILAPGEDAWKNAGSFHLEDGAQPAANFASYYDQENLHLAVVIPAADVEESKELGFSDELQIGLAHRTGPTEFGNDFLRLGFSANSSHAFDRTPGRRAENVVSGVKVNSSREGEKKRFEVTIPWTLIKSSRAEVSALVLDVSFPVPDSPEEERAAEPAVNSLSYRIRYGADSLVPVYFLELNLERKTR